MLSNEEINRATPEELVVAFIPMAKAYARKVCPDDPDAEQDACLSLVEAARTYDPAKGSFKAWAKMYMRRTVKRGKSLRERIISLPAAKVERLSDVLLAQENTPPEDNDDGAVAKRIGLTAKQVSDALSMPTMVQSIGNGSDDDGFDIEALFPAEDSGEIVMTFPETFAGDAARRTAAVEATTAAYDAMANGELVVPYDTTEPN